ncbi:hypothetical protein R0K05_25945, partial [Planococcus sp. SIMBA_160]
SGATPPTTSEQESGLELDWSSFTADFNLISKPEVKVVKKRDAAGRTSEARVITILVEAKNNLLLPPVYWAHFYDR